MQCEKNIQNSSYTLVRVHLNLNTPLSVLFFATQTASSNMDILNTPNANYY